MKKSNYLFIKPFFEYRNHYELVPSTLELLKNDGKTDVYNLLKSKSPATGEMYMSIIAKGAMDADLPWSCGYILHFYHFHHPWTHRGYLTHKSAADELARLFIFSQNLWREGKKDRAAYQLGRMLHLIQDIFIPHHAAVTAKSGHGQLENWLSSNWHFYTVEQGGCYRWEKTFKHAGNTIHTVSSKNPYDWIDVGSHISFPWYKDYFQDKEEDEFQAFFPQVASKIIPHTLRYSAGFINRFFVGLTLN